MTVRPRSRPRTAQASARRLRSPLAVPSLAVLAPAFAEEQPNRPIGPWETEATFKGDKIDRCTINRTLDDDIVASFVRTERAISALEPEPPNWKLDRGATYPVKMGLGPLSFDTEVAAEPNSVSVDVKDKKFVDSLRSADALNVVAAGATIGAARQEHRRLRAAGKCVEKNIKAVEKKPL